MLSFVKGTQAILSKALLLPQTHLTSLSNEFQTSTALFLGRYRKIRGGGRPLPPHVPTPTPNRYGWKVIFPEDGKYTTAPLPVHKLGGRNEQGRVAVRTLGGGNKKVFHWVDHHREPPQPGQVLEEKVLIVKYDPCRSARVALVANGLKQRWVVASQDMKVGDIIRAYSEIPRIPVQAKIGDSHPIGALPIGSIIHSIETLPGKGADICLASATCAQLVRKINGKCYIKMPSKREAVIDEKCMVVVGTVYNSGCKYPIGSAVRNRRLGKRPRSGWFHKKDGYCGFKNRPVKPLKVYVERPIPEYLDYEIKLYENPEDKWKRGHI